MNKIILYKKRLIDLLHIENSMNVLDYGCGSGDFIELIFDHYLPKSVHAVDSDSKTIDNVNCKLQNQITNNRLTTQVVDHPTKLNDCSYDRIISHNVLECVDDKISFINALHDKLDGKCLISHHDFDSVIFNSSHIELNRALIHHFADTKQSWQQFSDGQMGRKLRGLIVNSAFKNKAKFRTIRIIEYKFKPGYYGHLMADMIMDTAKGFLSPQDSQKWYDDLVLKSLSQQYYFAIDLNIALCNRYN